MVGGIGTYRLLGQDIFVGGVNADTWEQHWTLPTRACCYTATPSYFDGIQAVKEHNNGTLPTTDYTALWYDTDGYGDDPIFGISLTYNASGKFNLSYCFRVKSGDDIIWTGLYHSHYYNDGYNGVDPARITSEDRARQGIWFSYLSDGVQFMPNDEMFKYGYMLQHKGLHELSGGGFAYDSFYTFEPDTASLEMGHDIYGDYFDWSGGAAYAEAIDGYGSGNFDGLGVYVLLSSALSTEIEDYTDDTAGPGGGDSGNYGYFSIKVGIPPLPQISIMDTGAATMWCPSPEQCKDLCDYLWTDDFIDNIKKVNADPLANIIQFGVVPLNLASLRDTAKEVKVGNVGTGVQMYPLTTEYIQVDLGTINPWEKWSTSMDYEPNSRASLYIPMVGILDMPMSELYNKGVNLVYNVDLLSGDFVAFVRITGMSGKLDSVLYHKTGNMMLSFPLSSGNYSNFFKTVAAGVAGVAAGAATGNPGVIASSLGEMAGAAMSGGSSIQLNRTGNFSGVASALGCFEAYMILTQPEQHYPANYNEFNGYPSYLPYKLSQLSGFTKVLEVIDNTVKATDEEKAEIESLLKEGIFI